MWLNQNRIWKLLTLLIYPAIPEKQNKQRGEKTSLDETEDGRLQACWLVDWTTENQRNQKPNCNSQSWSRWPFLLHLPWSKNLQSKANFRILPFVKLPNVVLQNNKSLCTLYTKSLWCFWGLSVCATHANWCLDTNLADFRLKKKKSYIKTATAPLPINFIHVPVDCKLQTATRVQSEIMWMWKILVLPRNKRT